MTREHWQRIWQICEHARQVPREEQTGYVRANAADADMARQVLSLLAEPDDSVLQSWEASHSSANGDGSAAAEPARELAGLRIGRYAVSELIGRGASGDVYAARDMELERPVAIKFLRCGATHSHWSVDSFLREARAASALNHPGIITVYEVIQSESGLAIAMELVEGSTLRDFCGSPNSPEFAVRHVTQVARALAAAHKRQIIHRDIKPENIMNRADGLTKVLDFGLAQSLGGLGEGSVPGMLVGTVRYMSPEQAGGGSLTSATDVFSLGLVLYELVTGRHPFRAATVESVLQLVVSCSPEPPSRWRRDLPKPLESLILAMLNKVPEARPDAEEVARRLDALARPGGRPRVRFWLVAGLAALALAILGFFYWSKRQGTRPYEAASLVPVPLTSSTGFDAWPDISPDGNAIVYAWGTAPEAYTHLYLKEPDQDAPLKLVEAEFGVRIGRPKWSADGQHIFYKRTSPQPGIDSIWSVRRDGGDRRLVTAVSGAELSSGLDCSPDGKRLLFADRSPDDPWYHVYALDLASGQKTKLTFPTEGWGDWDPHYSPDGQRIAFKRVIIAGNDRLFVMPAGGGEARQIGLPRQSIYGHAWLTAERLLLSGQLSSSIETLWSVAAQGSADPAPLFESGQDSIMPAVRKNRIVWVNRADDYNIYSVPLAGGKPVKRLASPLLDSMPAFAPDGRLAFVSRRSGSPELWIAGREGTGAVRVTNLKGVVGRPAWSHDGTRLAFSIQRSGVTRLYVMRCPPGALQCETPLELGLGDSPAWSLDGASLYFMQPDQSHIAKLRLSDRTTEPVSDGVEARPSPDGKWLYIARIMANGRIYHAALESNGRLGAEELVLNRNTNSASVVHWALAGDEIVFWENDINSRYSGLRAFNMVNKKYRNVVETPSAEFPAVSPDGKNVWYAQADASGGTLMTADRPSR